MAPVREPNERHSSVPLPAFWEHGTKCWQQYYAACIQSMSDWSGKVLVFKVCTFCFNGVLLMSIVYFDAFVPLWCGVQYSSFHAPIHRVTDSSTSLQGPTAENTVCKGLDKLNAGYFCTRLFTLDTVLYSIETLLGLTSNIAELGLIGSFVSMPYHHTVARMGFMTYNNMYSTHWTSSLKAFKSYSTNREHQWRKPRPTNMDALNCCWTDV